MLYRALGKQMKPEDARPPQDFNGADKCTGDDHDADHSLLYKKLTRHQRCEGAAQERAHQRRGKGKTVL